MTGGTSLLNEATTTLITKFGSDVVATIPALIAIIVPVGLSLWAIGFGVKKGINFIQKKASKAV